MQATVREHQYMKASAALAAASVVALAPIAPVAPPPSPASVVERAVQLAAGDLVDLGIFNVPLNLFQDIVNVGANEIVAMDQAAKSLFYATNFFVPSATNVFGTDPGDLLHYSSILALLLPFSRDLSGVGSPVLDPAADAAGTAPLAQQISLLAAAEFPTSPSSEADWGAPFSPVPPITGYTPIDRIIYGLETFLGVQKFPLFDNWLQVPLSELMSGNFKFDLTTDPEGLVSSSMGTGENGSVPDDDVFGGIGTITPEQAAARGVELGTNAAGDPISTNAAGNPINFMPWTGLDFKLDLSHPFQAFFQSLMNPVDLSFHYGLPADLSNGVAAPLDGFVIPSFQDITQAFRALFAGSTVAFDPFTAGSPFCSGACITDGFPMIVDAVKTIGAVANNPLIDHWLDLVNTPNPYGDPSNPNLDFTDLQTGLINWATPHQIAVDIAYLQGQQNNFDFGNPSTLNPPIDGFYGVDTPEGVTTPIGFPIAPAIQDLIDFMKASGIQDFFHDLANLFGYTPIDYSLGTDAGDAGGTAATDTTDLSTLWSELMNPADWGSLF
jgi:hypothetical protein